MQEHVGNITFANDGEVEFENALMIALDYEFADAQITRIVNNACDDTKKFRTIFALMTKS
jgi:hypothetical protein